MSSSALTIELLTKLIREKKYDWQPGETSVSKLTLEVAVRKLGLAFKKEPLLAAHRRVYVMMAEVLAKKCPPKLDWRNEKGQNWITSIKDQGECGSCVSFASVAVMEAQAAIDSNRSDVWGDLSEAFLFFCGGGDCDTGWEVDDALDFLKGTGTTNEPCFPYPTPAVQQPCSNRCADWQRYLRKITDWNSLRNYDDARNWLCNKGPLVAGMDVYDDFRYYRGGIYGHVWGEKLGGHAIAVIGYDEIGRFWICKNSWGTGWGESGFFRIRYNDCNMLNPYPMYGVTT
nr:C1 family peptidase [Candidatus Njordarchaeum guaymaensis]